MGEVKGIQETKELVVFVARLATSVDASLADGKVGVDDAAQLMAPLMAIPAAFAGITEFPAEVADLDPAEAEELKEAIKAELDLRGDAVEVIVEEAIGAAFQLAGVIIQYVRAKKAEEEAAAAAPVA